MIGSPEWIGGTLYIRVNQHGTLMKLPSIPWYRRLKLYLLWYVGMIKTPEDWYLRAYKSLEGWRIYLDLASTTAGRNVRKG